MMIVSRRQFLGQAAALAALSPACGRSREQPTGREAVLAALVRRIALPDSRAILEQSKALADALQKAPSTEHADAAKTALRKAALTWQHAYAFRNGPIVETNAFLRSAFWPPRLDALREIVEGSDPLDAKFVAELGVDVKGVFALEHLLFQGPQPDAPAWLDGEHRERAHAFAKVLAAEALGYAEKAAKQMGDGKAFAKRFAEGGQANLNLLVNQMIGTLETTAARRLDHVVATHANGTLRMKDVQGAPSGLSAEIPRTWIATTQRVYAGSDPGSPGLSALVAAAAPRIDEQLRQTFAAASAAMQKLSEPLERYVERDPDAISAAVRAVKAVELALRVDLVSALGVTLTFTASDGD
jgi:uncharacterized protein